MRLRKTKNFDDDSMAASEETHENFIANSKSFANQEEHPTAAPSFKVNRAVNKIK